MWIYHIYMLLSQWVYSWNVAAQSTILSENSLILSVVYNKVQVSNSILEKENMVIL